MVKVDSTQKCRLVNGRFAGPTLADPGMDAKTEETQRRLFLTGEATIEYFHKHGVLTRTGKLTKAFGG